LQAVGRTHRRTEIGHQSAGGSQVRIARHAVEVAFFLATVNTRPGFVTLFRMRIDT
jgi:hypothetical protein